MISARTYEITNIPGHIESVTFSKRKPRADSESAVGVKKLTLWLAVEEHVTEVDALFAGVDMMLKAQAQGPGMDMRSKAKLGAAAITVRNATGAVLFSSNTAKGDRPRLVISSEARTAHLVVPVEVAIPRDSLTTLEDYFKADVLVDLANAQADLEDEANAAARRTTRRRRKEAQDGVE